MRDNHNNLYQFKTNNYFDINSYVNPNYKYYIGDNPDNITNDERNYNNMYDHLGNIVLTDNIMNYDYYYIINTDPNQTPILV